MMDPKYVPPHPAELAARKRRNIWLALALISFVVLMGVGTAIRISQGAGTSPNDPLYWDNGIDNAPQTVPAEPG